MEIDTENTMVKVSILKCMRIGEETAASRQGCELVDRGPIWNSVKS